MEYNRNEYYHYYNRCEHRALKYMMEMPTEYSIYVCKDCDRVLFHTHDDLKFDLTEVMYKVIYGDNLDYDVYKSIGDDGILFIKYSDDDIIKMFLSGSCSNRHRTIFTYNEVFKLMKLARKEVYRRYEYGEKKNVNSKSKVMLGYSDYIMPYRHI